MDGIADRIVEAARIIRDFEVSRSGYSELTARRHHDAICGLARRYDGTEPVTGPFGMLVVPVEWPDASGLGAEGLLGASESLATRLDGDGYCATKAIRARRVGRLLYLSLKAAGVGYTPANAEAWARAAAPHVRGQASSYGRTLREIACHVTGSGSPGLPRRGELDGMAEWAVDGVAGYLGILRREGLAEGTVASAGDACVRFVRHLERTGIRRWDDLDASSVRRWCLEDPHLTAHGRKTYVSKVRGLLGYLGETGEVDPGLYLAASAPVARGRRVADVLTEEEVSAARAARLSADTPLELRDAAMIALGLTMGLRACDVVGLRLADIDWTGSRVSIIQRKTCSQVDLPLTVAAGNALFAYLRLGRPDVGAAEVFVSHRCPHAPVGSLTCRDAMRRTFGDARHTFHALRRTFATGMLRGGASRADVAEALGHRGERSVGPYLSLDEERMRMCALSEADCREVR